MKLEVIKGTSKKGNTYYQLRISCDRFIKYLFITDIEAEYLISRDVPVVSYEK